MPAVHCEIVQVGTRTLVHLTGELTLPGVPAVRAVLAKCLVEQPDALVVDLARLTVAEPAALSVFPAVSRQAAVWPGTPLLICVPGPALAAALTGGGYGRLKVFPSVAQALAVPPARRLTAISDRLLPVSGATRRARDVATEACLRWELPHLTAPAALVAGELVTNAVVHARTMADLRLSLGRRYLMIAVRDGSSAVPRIVPAPPADPATGRGLVLVGAMARRWGSLPAEGGKVVWATLPTAR
nr:ATP-binding protein [Pseudosporangium ferrugineum]